MTLILLLILLAILGFLFLTYHRLINQIETIAHYHHKLDQELDRRFKIVDSLTHMIKKYIDVGHTILKEVTALHNKALGAKKSGDEKTYMASENQISAITSSINILFDQYPDLKSNPNAINLQKEIVSIENNLGFIKEAYNDSIEIYNTNKTSFPASILVSLFKNKLDFTFTPWQLKVQKGVQHEESSYTVQL